MTTMTPVMEQDTEVESNLASVGRGEAPVLEQLAQMTLDTRPRSGLDERTFTMVRIAALVGSDAPPASYLMNLGAAREIGIPLRDVQGLLVAVAPIVGTARTVTAAGNILRALGLAAALDEGEEEDEDDEETDD